METTVEFDSKKRVVVLVANREIKMSLKRKPIVFVADSAPADGKNIGQPNFGKYMYAVRIANGR
jgi:hypothetical protein